MPKTRAQFSLKLVCNPFFKYSDTKLRPKVRIASVGIIAVEATKAVK